MGLSGRAELSTFNSTSMQPKNLQYQGTQMRHSSLSSIGLMFRHNIVNHHYCGKTIHSTGHKSQRIRQHGHHLTLADQRGEAPQSVATRVLYFPAMDIDNQAICQPFHQTAWFQESCLCHHCRYLNVNNRNHLLIRRKRWGREGTTYSKLKINQTQMPQTQ